MRHADCSAYHYALPVRTVPCRYSWFQLSLMSTKASTLLSYTASTIPIAASTTVLEAHNNKQDILMPSQMFKADDSMQIIESHIPDINNLIESNVVEIHLIQSLPTSVKFLSYIWSYQWKRSPQGALWNIKLGTVLMNRARVQEGLLGYICTHGIVVHDLSHSYCLHLKPR